MHPILRDRRRRAVYLAVWMLLAVGLSAGLHVYGRLRLSWSLWLGLPAGLAYGFLCLSSWYPARALPLERTGVPRLLFVHAVGAAILTVLWLVALSLWAALLSRTRSRVGILDGFFRQLPILAGCGLLTYLLTAAVHHLMAPDETSRREGRRSLEAQLLAREAELKVLRAQIELASELSLVRGFLDIEKTRYGDRLQIEEEVGETAQRCLVPPLLLQPLVENAVRHGIAHRVDGGRVRLSAAVVNRFLQLRVENQRDPEAPTSRGEGLGLRIVQRRLEQAYRGEASLVVQDESEWCRVDIRLPAEQKTEG